MGIINFSLSTIRTQCKQVGRPVKNIYIIEEKKTLLINHPLHRNFNVFFFRINKY